MTRDGGDFTHWERRLTEMLVQHGHPGNIVWTFHEDYVCQGRTLIVGPITCLENRSLAKKMFDDVAVYPHGVRLTMITTFEGDAFCTMYGPPSADDAEYRMIWGIKLSIPVDLPATKRVVDGFAWARLTAARRTSRFYMLLDDHCQRKADVLAALGEVEIS